MASDSLTCGRENELIGFLYGELNESEALAFKDHLLKCSACNVELADLKPVRESIVAWRDESLGRVGVETIGDSRAAAARPSRPSAMAALREFFKLSPLWLKGAVAFTAVLFCVFAGLAVASLRNKLQSPVVSAPITSDSSNEFNAAVEKRVHEELERVRNSSERPGNSTLAENRTAQENSGGPIVNHKAQSARSNLSEKARRPLSKSEREQLAADLRLGSSGDSDLDLLDDKINQ